MGIVDDAVALEGEETFQLFFDTLPEGVVAGDPSREEITIIDNDGQWQFVPLFCVDTWTQTNMIYALILTLFLV